VEGDRYLAHGSPRSRQALRRLAYHGVDIGLGIGPANDPDPQAAGWESAESLYSADLPYFRCGGTEVFAAHRYFSVVENKRVGGGRVVQRHVLYLGEINDTQEHAWRQVDRGPGGRRRSATNAVAVPKDRCEGLKDCKRTTRLSA
jgi:hypothetical protein